MAWFKGRRKKTPRQAGGGKAALPESDCKGEPEREAKVKLPSQAWRGRWLPREHGRTFLEGATRELDMRTLTLAQPQPQL